MEQIIYEVPVIRRTNAEIGTQNFSADGNTYHTFNFISDFLKKKDLEQAASINTRSLNSLFFDTFDRLNGKTFTNYEERIDSFTHPWLQVDELLAIIAYLDNTFLDVFPFEFKNYFNDVYIRKHIYNTLNEEYNDDDQSIRISTARNFLNMKSHEYVFSKFMPKFEC
jgi:hypothetical protein